MAADLTRRGFLWLLGAAGLTSSAAAVKPRLRGYGRSPYGSVYGR
jgi:hypothetical protein